MALYEVPQHLNNRPDIFNWILHKTDHRAVRCCPASLGAAESLKQSERPPAGVLIGFVQQRRGKQRPILSP